MIPREIHLASILRTKSFFQKFGWRVFPVRGKAPVYGCMWQTEERPGTEAQWQEATGLGFAIPKNVVVIDIDRHKTGCPKPVDCSCECPAVEGLREKFAPYPTPFVVLTPRGGYHLYYKDPENIGRNTTKAIHPQVDTKAHGGYVLLPPSSHDAIPDKLYEWEDLALATEARFDLDALPELPSFLLSAFAHEKEARKAMDPRVLYQAGAIEGDRHTLATYHAGIFWGYWAKTKEQVNGESLAIILAAMNVWDAKNKPPLGVDHIYRVVKDIGERHYARLRE